MPTFCDDWLAHSKRNEQVVCSSPIVAPGAGLKFVEAPQDVRTAVVIGAANGFPTQGTVLLKSEIPTGWHTASHIDGQEAMFVLEGSAFAVADGRHYDFKAGTMMHVACTSEQTLVNTRSRPASYPSARTPEVDLQVLPGRFEQRNEKGEGNDPLMVAHPTEETHSALWRPIALHTEGMADAAEEARLGAASGNDHHGHGELGRHRQSGCTGTARAGSSSAGMRGGRRVRPMASSRRPPR